MKERNPVVKLEALRKNEHYKRHNIFTYEYTKDVVEQLLKNYWEVIEAGRDSNPNMTDVWIDLTSAINALDERTRKVIYAYAEGWRAIALTEKTQEPRAAHILGQGILQIVESLNTHED